MCKTPQIMILNFVLMLTAMFLIGGCATDTDMTGDLTENCLKFCERRMACDSAEKFDDAYLTDCNNACYDGDYYSTDLDMNETLISCAKNESCSLFHNCLIQGGSITDDEYGKYSQDR